MILSRRLVPSELILEQKPRYSLMTPRRSSSQIKHSATYYIPLLRQKEIEIFLWCFCFGSCLILLNEAKRPSPDMKEDIQTKTYAYKFSSK